MTKKVTNDPLPKINQFLLRGFRGYSRRLIRKHFHSVAVTRGRARDAEEAPDDEPLIVYANHPGWWDPLTANYICETCFPSRAFYAPIDAAALQQYAVLGKLGFYGINLDSTSGAAKFLKTSQAILNTSATSIWLTPEGKFCDPRDDSAELMPGLAHLASRLERGKIVPLAIEYSFWEEKLPELLFSLGEPIDVTEHSDLTKPQWSTLITDGLRKTQAHLADRVVSREIEEFEVLMRGGKGTGILYDISRRMRSLFGGTSYKAHHGEKLN